MSSQFGDERRPGRGPPWLAAPSDDPAREPTVTIVMPCLNEARHIDGCLRSVLEQDLETRRIEVLVVDGGSTDGTREIVARFAAGEPRITLVDNPARIQAAGMNEGIRRARGEVIVRMDVHCEYDRSYVRKCLDALERTGADNVGGAQRARAQTRFQRAVCAALDSPLGVGNAWYRSKQREGFVDTVFLGAFRRGVFEEVGLYDEAAVTNEDAELNHRILAAGGRIYLSRDIVVQYYPRASFRALARQYFRYGCGRARTVLKHRKIRSLRAVLPAGLVAGGIVALATSGVQPFTPFLFGAYASVTALEALRVGRGGGAAQALTIWPIFPVIHVSHGLGFLSGVARHLFHHDWTAPERLARRGATWRPVGAAAVRSAQLPSSSAGVSPASARAGPELPP